MSYKYKRARGYARNWKSTRRTSSAAPSRRKRGVRAPTASRRRLRAIANLRTGGLLGMETKFYDSVLAGIEPAHNFLGTTALNTAALDADAVAPSAADVYYLNCPGVGSAAYQRDGRVITNLSIEITGHVVQIDPQGPWTGTTPNISSGVHDDMPRQCCVALVLDTQCNGQSPVAVPPEVWTSPFAGGGSTLDEELMCYPLRNLSSGSRFRVLAFKRLSLNKTPNYGHTGSFNIPFRMFRRLGFKTHFTTASSTPASNAIVDNGIFLCAWYNYERDPDSAGPTVWNRRPKLSCNARLRFQG